MSCRLVAAAYMQYIYFRMPSGDGRLKHALPNAAFSRPSCVAIPAGVKQAVLERAMVGRPW